MDSDAIKGLQQAHSDMDAQLAAAEQAINALTAIAWDANKPPSGPYALFHHASYSIERLKDLRTIVSRLIDARLGLLEADRQKDQIEGSIGHEAWRSEAWRAEHEKAQELTSALKLDFETLYIFSGIFLDQFAIATAYTCGLKRPEAWTLSTLVTAAEAASSAALSDLWSSHGRSMLWLDAQVRSFRNRFIVHYNRPWQRGFIHEVFGSNFQLFVPSPPGWLNDDALTVELAKLYERLDVPTKRAVANAWDPTKPRRLLEVLLGVVGDIQDVDLRESLVRLARNYGGTTPSFVEIAAAVCCFAQAGWRWLAARAAADPTRIVLGAPASISEGNEH